MQDEQENWEGQSDEAQNEPTPEPQQQTDPGRQLVAQRKAQLVANERGYIAPTTVEEAARMAAAVIAGNLAPSSYDRDPTKIMLGIMSALEAGLPPLYGLRQIAIINGRPTIWGDGAVALVQSKNLIAAFDVERIGPKPENPADLSKWPDDYGIKVTIKRRNQAGEYVGTFTVGMAKRAKLWMNAKKMPWLEHPERMLLNRARAFALRDGFADALGGIAIREEIEDMLEEKDERHVAIDLSDEPTVEVPPMPEAEPEAEPEKEELPL